MRDDALRWMDSATAELGACERLEDVLRIAARGLTPLRPSVAFLIEPRALGPSLLWILAGRPIELDEPLVSAALSRAAAALATPMDTGDLRIWYIEVDWPSYRPANGPPDGETCLLGRPIDCHGQSKAFFALELAGPLDAEIERGFDRVVSWLALPLENARLTAAVADARSELADVMGVLGRTQNALVAAERMASIGHLAAGVAHEINNPLAFVISNLNVLREYARDITHLLKLYRAGRIEEAELVAHRTNPDYILHDLDALVAESLDGANRVHAIVRDLRSFSHAEQHEGDHVHEVDLNEVVESTLNIARGMLRARATVIRELRPVPSIRGDHGRLAQVFLNLVTNAAQAIPAGVDGRITIRLFSRRGEVALQVEDNGNGIPEDLRERIFEPFFTTKDVGIGSGLGLAIANEIARRHNGRLSVESEPGKGSRFTLWIPSRTTLPMPAVSVEPGPIDQPEASVVFIDDEPFLLNAYRRAFSRSIRVHLANGGEEGIRLLARLEDVDVVLCDLIMPRVGGIDVYAWVRSHRPELVERFVIITGGQQSARAHEFLARTDLPVVHKPFNVSELSRMILRYAQRRRRR